MRLQSLATTLAALLLVGAIAGCHGSSTPTCSLSNPASLATSSWPKSRHDLQNTGVIGNVSLSSNPTGSTLFSASFAGAQFIASPVLGNDDKRLYIGTSPDGVFYAFNLANKTNDFTFTALEGITQAALAATRFGADAVFFGAGDGILQALDSTGTAQPNFWPFGLGNGLTTAPAFNGIDGTVYAAGGPLIFAVCPNGIERFGYSFPHSVRSTPGFGADGTAYFGADDRLIRAVDFKGALLWTFSTSAPVSTAVMVGLSASTPPQTTAIYAVDSNGYFYKLSSTGQLLVSAQLMNNLLPVQVTTVSPALVVTDSSERLYVLGDDGTLLSVDVAADAVTFATLFSAGSPVRSSPAVAHSGTRDVIVFGADNGNVYFVYSDATAPVAVAVGAPIQSSPAIGCRRDSNNLCATDNTDGTVYIGADDGKMQMIK
ncbi:MAG: PQQ-binding-like beta-propeller repeat protein [Deltaproteobacteria bacterium]|nr:PQQ-binding-like beta-propeller repeat protein [Deltaproteobacteria bacterium]